MMASDSKAISIISFAVDVNVTPSILSSAGPGSAPLNRFARGLQSDESSIAPRLRLSPTTASRGLATIGAAVVELEAVSTAVLVDSGKYQPTLMSGVLATLTGGGGLGSKRSNAARSAALDEASARRFSSSVLAAVNLENDGGHL
jgi:hypothetical protein